MLKIKQDNVTFLLLKTFQWFPTALMVRIPLLHIVLKPFTAWLLSTSATHLWPSPLHQLLQPNLYSGLRELLSLTALLSFHHWVFVYILIQGIPWSLSPSGWLHLRGRSRISIWEGLVVALWRERKLEICLTAIFA